MTTDPVAEGKRRAAAHQATLTSRQRAEIAHHLAQFPTVLAACLVDPTPQKGGRVRMVFPVTYQPLP